MNNIYEQHSFASDFTNCTIQQIYYPQEYHRLHTIVHKTFQYKSRKNQLLEIVISLSFLLRFSEDGVFQKTISMDIQFGMKMGKENVQFGNIKWNPIQQTCQMPEQYDNWKSIIKPQLNKQEAKQLISKLQQILNFPKQGATLQKFINNFYLSSSNFKLIRPSTTNYEYYTPFIIDGQSFRGLWNYKVNDFDRIVYASYTVKSLIIDSGGQQWQFVMSVERVEKGVKTFCYSQFYMDLNREIKDIIDRYILESQELSVFYSM